MKHSSASYDMLRLQGPREYQQDSVISRSTIGVFGVADGMGGMPGGDKASSFCMQILNSLCEGMCQGETVEVIERTQQEVSAPPISLVAGMLIRSLAVGVHSFLDQEKLKTGTTLSFGVFRENFVAIGHVGDSRIYRIRGMQVDCLTVDHRGPRNSLLSCIGMKGGPMYVHATIRSWRPGDVFLFCTDGFYEAILKGCGLSSDDYLLAQRHDNPLIRLAKGESIEEVIKPFELHDNTTLLRVKL